MNARDCVRNRMARHPQMRKISGGETQTSVSAELSGDEESEEENINWRKCAMKLEEENDIYEGNYRPRT
jgi:hypothetical protein